MKSLAELAGTHWVGDAELWLDPLGDSPDRSDCTLAIDNRVVAYTWSYDGTQHHGSIALQNDRATFTDSWHQPEPMECKLVTGRHSLFQVQGTYGPDNDWGWRIMLSRREPTGELVLQMTNIAPWGEETRAVRMVGTPQ
jgi:hypothetical protein